MKLQNELLKAIEKQENATLRGYFPYKVTTGIDDYYNFGITDGHFIKFYNKKHFFVNTDNDYFNPDPFNVSKITDLSETRPLTLTMEFKTDIQGKTYDLIELTFLDNNEKMYIDAKFKKYFETKYISFKDYTFLANNRKSPLILKMDGNIHGLILPLNYNRG